MLHEFELEVKNVSYTFQTTITRVSSVVDFLNYIFPVSAFRANGLELDNQDSIGYILGRASNIGWYMENFVGIEGAGTVLGNDD